MRISTHRIFGLALALLLAAPARARATVSTTTSVVEYTCNGTLKTFTVPFRFLDLLHLRVSRVLIASPYTETVLTVGADYSVGGAGSATGGTVALVTPSTACATGYKLRIRRLTPRTQGTALSTQGPFNPKALEAMADRQTMIAQELNDGSLIAQRWFDFTVQGPPDTALVTAAGGTVPRTLADQLGDVVNVKSFGAIADFNPATGAGTNNRAAIQAALDKARDLGPGVRVVFPPGRYRVQGDWPDARAYGTVLGLADASGVTIDGDGAELYQDDDGKLLSIVNSADIKIRGLKLYGYIGGALVSTREGDALLAVVYGSKRVTIEGAYIVAGLGDCIRVGGSLTSGGQLGYEARDVTIRGSTLKSRVGNGVASVSGGTTSRMGIAAIDAIGLTVTGNTIYGSIDLEPNLDGQHEQSIAITGNRFVAGPVTPYATVPVAADHYWYDEPIATSGGTQITNAVTITGTPGNPVVSDNVVSGNTFENGLVSESGPYKFAKVVGNHFVVGQIVVGATSGSNVMNYVEVANNTADGVPAGETRFVKLAGNLYYSRFANNFAEVPAGYVVGDVGGSTGDASRNQFVGNRNRSATALGALSITSQKDTSTYRDNSYDGAAVVTRSQDTHVGVKSITTTILPVALTSLNQTVDWRSYPSSIWQLSGATYSLQTVSNVPDGLRLTLLSGLSGSNSLTIVDGSGGGSFRLRGGTNATFTGANVTMEFVARAGVLFEVGRNF